MPRRRTALLALLFAATACDSGTKDDPCPWLSGDNCWKAALAAAAPCLHAASVVGEMSADSASCAFDDGVSIAFNVPFDATADQPDKWDFTIEKDGEACLSYQQTNAQYSTDLSLTTPAGALTVHADPGTYDVSCPDATTYSFSPLDMLNCNGVFGASPGIVWTGNLTLSFNGGADGSVMAFRCEAP